MRLAACATCGADITKRCGSVVKLCLPCGYKASPSGGAARAWRLVSAAVSRGDLKPARDHVCVDCGKQASVYDHRDYSKPLDVQPVCRSCNKLRGAGVRVAEAA